MNLYRAKERHFSGSNKSWSSHHNKGLAATLLVIGFFLVLPISSARASHVDGQLGRPADGPRIVNWDYEWGIDSDEEARELAQWDVLIIDIESEYYSRDRLKLVKKINPDIKLIAYIGLSSIRKDASSMDKGTARNYLGTELDAHPEWILRTADGTPAEWWPGNYIRNLTDLAPEANGTRVNKTFTKFLRDAVVKDKLWDGIFLDNLWEGIGFVSPNLDIDMDGKADSKTKVKKQWRMGTRGVLKRLRKQSKKYRNNKFIITGNGGTGYSKQINGVGFEHFPTTTYGKWTDSMEEYIFIVQNAVPTRYAWINTNTKNKKGRTNYRKFRYGLMSTLLNDGYYSFDKGDQSHTEKWYYDEYNVSLGEATSGAYNLKRPDDPTKLRKGVWRRDYEKASVFVNSTSQPFKVKLNTGYEKIKGDQDPGTNSGDIIGTVTIPPKDGIILLRRLTQVRDATFINGAFSKVFNGQGKQVRNSFFAFDGSFPGGTQVHKVSRSSKSVVADNTYVRVYNRFNQINAEFTPYGSDYHDGVNIAVGKLFGGKKSYIVVGNKKGNPFVRIYDLKGNLIHGGCRPYGDGFQGGVNVAVGDLNGDNRQEIIVAAGFGGGPHIRMLNNACVVINPGFFAFSETLRIGVNLAVGDLNNDGKAEIIASSGPGGGPHVRIFNKNGKMLSAGFFAYGQSDRSGVLVSTADINKDGSDEIVTSSFSIFNQF